MPDLSAAVDVDIREAECRIAIPRRLLAGERFVMMQRFHQLSMQRKVVVIAIILLAGSGVVLGAVRLGKRAPTVPTIEVKRGEFLDSMQFRGEVKALKSVTISAPAEAGDLQIVKVSAEGTAVKPGDVVVEFDKTKTEQDLAQFRSASEIGGSGDRPGPSAGAAGRRRRQDRGAEGPLRRGRRQARGQQAGDRLQDRRRRSQAEAGRCRAEAARSRDETEIGRRL